MFPGYRILQCWSLLLQPPLTVQCSQNHLQPSLYMSKQLFPCEEHQELQKCVWKTPLDDLEESKQWLICCNPRSFTRIRKWVCSKDHRKAIFDHGKCVRCFCENEKYFWLNYFIFYLWSLTSVEGCPWYICVFMSYFLRTNNSDNFCQPFLFLLFIHFSFNSSPCMHSFSSAGTSY